MGVAFAHERFGRYRPWFRACVAGALEAAQAWGGGKMERQHREKMDGSGKDLQQPLLGTADNRGVAVQETSKAPGAMWQLFTRVLAALHSMVMAFLGWISTVGDWSRLTEAALDASEADAVVVVLGTDGAWEVEGGDQASMELPGAQAQLVERVMAAAAEKPVVVVLNVGSPKAVSGIAGAAPAVLLSYFGGMCGADALVDVLFGKTTPGGRLPTTWPKDLQNSPAVLKGTTTAATTEYGEGIWLGYRHYDRAQQSGVLFPFGHGLSYSTFQLGQLELEGESVQKGEPRYSAGQDVRCAVEVRNTGEVDDSMVVQLYVRQSGADQADNPRKELRDFSKSLIKAGGSARLSFQLSARAFSRFDEDSGCWTVRPGSYDLIAATSAGADAERSHVSIQYGV